MTPSSLLRDDHKKVRGLFRQLEALAERTPDRVEPISRELFVELEIHSLLEREIFYPALLDRAENDFEARAELGQAEAAHDFVDGALRELRQLSATADGWWDRVVELRDAVETHFSQEEENLLPAGEKYLGEADVLIDRMLERRRMLLKNPRQSPNGGEQKRRAG
jgi:hypothetical protein